MVLTHTTNHTYAHPFPTVTLAYFLRYSSPQLNPFAAHVLSTDTIASHVDPATGRLHTIRIHNKKSRLPAAVLKLLPASVTGGVGSNGDKASYVLETSVVDMRGGWMQTESRNLNFVGVLSVIEQQLYTAPGADAAAAAVACAVPASQGTPATTDVATTVVFRSRLGERIRERIGQSASTQATPATPEELQSLQPQQQQQEGWFAKGWAGGWGKKGIQRSIESLASTRTQDQLGKSREGMRVVLERLRNSGIIGVLEMRRRASQGLLEAA